MAGIDSIGKNLAVYMPLGATTVYQVLVQLLPATNTTAGGGTAAVCDAKDPNPANRAMLGLIITFLSLCCFLAPFVVAGKKQKDGQVTYHFLRVAWGSHETAPQNEHSTDASDITRPMLSSTVQISHPEPSQGVQDSPVPRPLLWRHVIRACVSLTAFLTFTLLSTDATNCFFGGKTPQAARQVLTALVALASSIIMGFLPHPDEAEAWPFGAVDNGLPVEVQKYVQEAKSKVDQGSGKAMVKELTDMLVKDRNEDEAPHQVRSAS